METVRINGIIFEANDTVELAFNGYEELNNAKLTIELPFDIEFEYFDEIIIDEKYYFYLIDYVKEIINPKKWRYTYTLVNPAINLQNIILPNRAIEKGKSLKTTFDNYMEMYLDSNIKKSIRLDNLLSGLTQQYTWAEPTLYEVFNTLLEEKNVIITMTDFYTLDYIELDKMGVDISNYKINNIVTKTDYTNHATELVTKLQNAISDNTKTEVINFITPNEPVFNDSRFGAFTKHPIEKNI